MRRALVLAALLALVIAVPAEAKKPVKPSALAAAVLVSTDADTNNIHAGDLVTFTATHDAAWRFWLLCYQDGRVVIDGRGKYFVGFGSVTYGLISGAYNNNPVGADCEVWVAEWVGFSGNADYGVEKIPEPLRFTLLP